jgi:hypothetical protein
MPTPSLVVLGHNSSDDSKTLVPLRQSSNHGVWLYQAGDSEQAWLTAVVKTQTFADKGMGDVGGEKSLARNIAGMRVLWGGGQGRDRDRRLSRHVCWLAATPERLGVSATMNSMDVHQWHSDPRRGGRSLLPTLIVFRVRRRDPGSQG